MRYLQALLCLACAFSQIGCGGGNSTYSPPAEYHRESDVGRTNPTEKPMPDDDRPSGFQSGTLTAGSIDDNRDFAEYKEYFSTELQAQRFQGGGISIGQRVEIRVQNGQGAGIGDARVTVTPLTAEQVGASSQPVLLDTTTGSDGRTLFCSQLDGAAGATQFLLTVEPPGGAEAITQHVTLTDVPWTVTLEQTEQQLPTRLDLSLVIDTTGSMSDELRYLQVEIEDIVAQVRQRFPNVDQRLSLILYRDQGDAYVLRTFDFTSSLEQFQRDLAAQCAKGGGDYPEAVDLALEQATKLTWRDRDTARVLFLVGDAPPHAERTEATIQAIHELRLQGVTLFPVAASGARDEAEFLMRFAAFQTCGQYLFLTDHSGVGNPHAKPDKSSYGVETLRQLMVRMIETELSGRQVLPEDLIAVEKNEQAATPVVTQPEVADRVVQKPKPPKASLPIVPPDAYDDYFNPPVKATLGWELGTIVQGIAVCAIILAIMLYEAKTSV